GNKAAAEVYSLCRDDLTVGRPPRRQIGLIPIIVSPFSCLRMISLKPGQASHSSRFDINDADGVQVGDKCDFFAVRRPRWLRTVMVVRQSTQAGAVAIHEPQVCLGPASVSQGHPEFAGEDNPLSGRSKGVFGDPFHAIGTHPLEQLLAKPVSILVARSFYLAFRLLLIRR